MFYIYSLKSFTYTHTHTYVHDFKIMFVIFKICFLIKEQPHDSHWQISASVPFHYKNHWNTEEKNKLDWKYDPIRSIVFYLVKDSICFLL